MTGPTSWPQPSGDAWALGPGVIASTEEPRPDTVLNWHGVNFTPQEGEIPRWLCVDCLTLDPERRPSPAVTWSEGSALCLEHLRRRLEEGPPPEATR